jgi:hypothetical protein
MKCVPWAIVPANSFPVDSGIEESPCEEHTKALVEFAYCYYRQNSCRETGMATDISWPRHCDITVAMPTYRYRPRQRRELRDIHVTKR